ncbi:putative secretion system X transmembrane protein 2 [Comamonas testosteroni]|nr:putative secretion system X transmembrane protein 2 [Comamonas testosteroni]
MLEVWFWRQGWGIPVLGLLLTASALVYWLAIDAKQALRADDQTLQLQKGRLTKLEQSQPAAPPIDPEQETLAALKQIAYSDKEVNALIRRVYAMAAEHQVRITEAEYRLTTQGYGGFHQQKIMLPVQAPYPRIKALAQQMLRDFHGMSIDQLMLHREDIARDKPEVTIRLSFWVLPGKPLATAPDNPPTP